MCALEVKKTNKPGKNGEECCQAGYTNRIHQEVKPAFRNKSGDREIHHQIRALLECLLVKGIYVPLVKETRRKSLLKVWGTTRQE